MLAEKLLIELEGVFTSHFVGLHTYIICVLNRYFYFAIFSDFYFHRNKICNSTKMTFKYFKVVKNGRR